MALSTSHAQARECRRCHDPWLGPKQQRHHKVSHGRISGWCCNDRLRTPSASHFWSRAVACRRKEVTGRLPQCSAALSHTRLSLPRLAPTEAHGSPRKDSNLRTRFLGNRRSIPWARGCDPDQLTVRVRNTAPCGALPPGRGRVIEDRNVRLNEPPSTEPAAEDRYLDLGSSKQAQMMLPQELRLNPEPLRRLTEKDTQAIAHSCIRLVVDVAG